MGIDTFVGLIALDPSTKRRSSSNGGRQDHHSRSKARMHRTACIHVRVWASRYERCPQGCGRRQRATQLISSLIVTWGQAMFHPFASGVNSPLLTKPHDWEISIIALRLGAPLRRNDGRVGRCHSADALLTFSRSFLQR